MSDYTQPLVGTPLDYSKRENWMFFNDLDDKEHDVDVFYLYPTAVSNEVKTPVCENIEDMRLNAHIFYAMSADTFASFTNMYAPYYRQLSTVSILKNPNSELFAKALRENVTITDVYAALDYYFENCNNGKPYILAGHSQGSCSLKIVLSEYMKVHPEYMKNLVACYPIGMYFPDSWFEENPQIKKATGETDTGVLITWNTEGPDATMPNMCLGHNDGFNINPLNWKTDETPADISMNKGSLFVDRDMCAEIFGFVSSMETKNKPENMDLKNADKEKIANTVRNLMMKHTEGVADAVIDSKRGTLVTTTYKNYLPANPLFGDKCLHMEDWSLYTMNIRENAQKRIAAFLGHEGK